MGVKSLWTLLTPVGRPVMLETVEGKTMAIDSSIWIYQFQATMRDKEGRGLVNAHVLGFLRRITKLLFYGIKPVFVFDGGAPTLKRATLNERKKKKAGAALNHAQLAERILAAKMRREAVEHASGGQGSGKKHARDAPLDDDTVYLEDIINSQPKTPKKSKTAAGPSSSEKKKKFHDHDPYHLPEVDLDAAVAKRTQDAATADPRLATEDELHAFLASITPEDLDIASPEFHTLPTNIQYELIGDLRLKSRQTSHARLQKMLRGSQTPLDFSKAQIAHLKERNQLTQRLLMTTDSIGSAHIAIPVRIASERNREYVLVKNAGAEGGWILGIRDLRGTEDKPIVLDHEEEDRQAKPNKARDVDSDEDMEEVATMDPDLRAYQGEMALSGIGNRVSNPRKTIPTSLFLNEIDSDRQVNSKRYTPQRPSAPQDDEDDLLAMVIQQSLDDAKKTSTLSPHRREAPSDAVDTSHEELEEDDDDMYVPYPDFTPLGTALSFANAISRPLVSPSKGKNTPMAAISSPVGSKSTSEPSFSFSFKGTGLLGTLKESEPEIAPPMTLDDDMSQQQREMDTLLKQTTRLLQEQDGESDDDMEEVVDFPTTAPDASNAPLTTTTGQPLLTPDNEESDDDMEEVVVESFKVPVPSIEEPDSSPSAPSLPALSDLISLPTRKQRPTDEILDFDMEAIEISVPVVRKALQVSPQQPPKPKIVPLTDRPRVSSKPLPTSVDISQNTPKKPASASVSTVPLPAPSTVTSEMTVRVEPPPKSILDAAEEMDSDEELIPWSRSPSPTRGTDGVPSESVHNAAWDAAQEMDPHAEEGEFVKFLSQVKGKNMDTVRQEIDEELRVLNQQRRAAMRDAEDVTQQMITQIMIMLRLFGIPYITAPMEAEAQCAELVTLGLVDGVITDDSDVFLFGAQRVYKNMFNQSKTVECFLASDLSRELGLTRDTLIQLAYLLGSDYTEGLPGVGPVVAMELLKEFPGRDGLFKFRDWWLAVQSGKDKEEGQSSFKRRFKKRFKDLYLTSDWPNTAVRDAYYHPTVDNSDEPFKWGLPDLDGLHQFLHQELGWQSSKVDELLLPIIQKMNKRRAAAASNQQGVLNEFLDISASGTHAPRQRQAYASKRLQQVISDFRRRQKRGSVAPDGNEDTIDVDEADEDDSVKPAAKKRRRQSSTPKSSTPGPSKPPKKPRAAKKPRKKVQKSATPSDDADDSPTNADDDEKEGNSPTAGQTINPSEDPDRRAALSLRPRPKPRPTYKGAPYQSVGVEMANPGPSASPDQEALGDKF